MNGGAALRLRSLVATDETTNAAPSRSRSTSFDCSSSLILMFSSRCLTSLASNSGGDRTGERRKQVPVLLRHESRDLLLAIADQLQRHGLDAARAQTAADFVPEQGADLVADEAIEHAARLLRIDHLHVDLARMVHRFLHRLLGDLVEHEAVDLLLLRAELFGEMPADGFAFAVRVGGDVNVGGVLCRALQLGDHFLAGGDRFVHRREAFVDVDTELALRQIADVPHRREHLVVASEILIDCLCLRR